MPRIVALSMVKNEQDVIEPFVRHSKLFVDYHVILDNGSVDETRRILTDLMRELNGVVVTTSSAFGYNQSERMTQLLRLCQTAFFADYVIFLDADEFIGCESRAEFEEILADIPVGGYGRIPWQTFVVTPFSIESERHDPPRTIPWRRAKEHERDNAVLCLRGRYWHDLVIAQGNHSVSSLNGRPIASVRLDRLRLKHFPLRSINQFVGKSIVGWMAYLGKDPYAAQKGEGYHWYNNFKFATNGGAISFEALCDLSMRYDQPHQEYDWSADVVLDVPPTLYERRYSSGRYADPLILVAKSWQATLDAKDQPIVLLRKDASIRSSEKSDGESNADSDLHLKGAFADIPPFLYLIEKYQPRSMLDVGCGIGAYVTLFKNLGTQEILGIDCIPGPTTMLNDEQYQQVDLSQPVALGRKFDVVLCLEAAGYLPEDVARNILETLRTHAQGLIVFSAAEPDQPGRGHLNSLPLVQWLRRWQALGWLPLLDETLSMRAISTLPWLRRNLVVLKHGAEENSEDAIRELACIGSLPFTWYHCDPGVRAEVLAEDMPSPPFGYRSES